MKKADFSFLQMRRRSARVLSIGRCWASINAEAAHPTMLTEQDPPGRVVLEDIPDSDTLAEIEFRDHLCHWNPELTPEVFRM